MNGEDVKAVSSILAHYDAGFTLKTYVYTTRVVQEEVTQKMGAFIGQVM